MAWRRRLLGGHEGCLREEPVKEMIGQGLRGSSEPTCYRERDTGRAERDGDIGRVKAFPAPAATSVSPPLSHTQWALYVLMVTSATARRLEAGRGENRRRGGR
ncbi:hypothetical protein E2C01_085390 [Portunus trituberculatus]|uniref:Uncharacterized protein n=1 Tax=Portunus trituberculatus TaxID=210409 RepID=A0A5B7JDG8_PORTR|nr:hypothetical protein [Portunus trituberculatus]